MSHTQHPSITLHHGQSSARLNPSLGGRIATCELRQADGRIAPVLHPFPEGETQVEQWAKGGIYPLVPYWGRIDQAVLKHAGVDHALAVYPEAAPHTLHGIAQRRPWRVKQTTPDTALLDYQHEPDAHWPWAFAASLQVNLAEMALHVELILTNTSDTTMPAGIGFHPYLPRTASLRLRVQAERAWGCTADYLATQPIAIPAESDFATERPFSDAGFTAFYENWQSPLTLCEGQGPRLLLTASSSLNHLVLHQPVGMPYVCVEPVSHVANAFNLAEQGMESTGAVFLPAGASLSGRMLLAWEQVTA